VNSLAADAFKIVLEKRRRDRARKAVSKADACSDIFYKRGLNPVLGIRIRIRMRIHRIRMFL
jgi:hypothetical protein